MGDEQKVALAEAESFCLVFSDMPGCCLPLKLSFVRSIVVSVVIKAEVECRAEKGSSCRHEQVQPRKKTHTGHTEENYGFWALLG